MKFLINILLSFGCLLIAVNAAFACQCKSLTLAQKMNMAYAVFTGRVVEHKTKSIKGRYLHLFKIDVERSWKNAEVKKITVYSEGGCLSWLEPGQKYLVFAYRERDGRYLETDTCAGTGKLELAGEALKELGEGKLVKHE